MQTRNRHQVTRSGRGISLPLFRRQAMSSADTDRCNDGRQLRIGDRLPDAAIELQAKALDGAQHVSCDEHVVSPARNVARGIDALG